MIFKYFLIGLLFVSVGRSESILDSFGISGIIDTIANFNAEEVSEQIYYTALGWLRNSDIAPIICSALHPMMASADSVPDTDTLFFIYNKSEELNFTMPYALETIGEIVSKNPQETITILIHGYTDSSIRPTLNLVKDAFQTTDANNFFLMGCEPMIGSQFNLFQAMMNSAAAGIALGDLLYEITTKYDIDPSVYNIVGHSMGAHLAGYAGKRFYNLTGTQLGQITGMDPVGLCYDYLDASERMAPTDAEYVDVIHTDNFVYGSELDIYGNANFWVNGGVSETNGYEDSHQRIVPIYAESIINPSAFIAVQCDDLESFKAGNCNGVTGHCGFHSEHTSRGNFYFQTGSSSPYDLGSEGTVYSADRE